jgi:predicted regulator of Ras-like GTPase activity (Roadblock/LC7/MglB family)
MDAAQALADLTEISSQIEAAVLFGGDAQVAGSTLADVDAATLARAADELLNQAAGLGDGEVTQIEASTPDGNVFVVREGPRCIAATTGPDPTTGLVFYDLKSALRDSAVSDTEKPRRRRPPKKADDAA